MDLEIRLQEIGEYLKEKVTSGDFDFIDCDEHTARIKIEGKVLEVWIANNPQKDFEFHLGFFESPVLGDYVKFTKKERLAGWKKVKPFVEKYRRNELKKEKIKQLQELEEEIKNL